MKIKLDLHKSTDAKEFSPKVNELIHHKEFIRVTSWINERIHIINKIDNRNSRKHDTISILGQRGTGKTSFVLSLKEHYSESPDIEPLKIIDPTLIEEKGHVFLNIISIIKEVVDKILDQKSQDPTDSSYHMRVKWNQKLELLAKGIPSIDGVGAGLSTNEWQDAEYIMHRGIRAVAAARELESNFNALIELALDIIKKKAFLLILDDIDVSFSKGWPVLETIRKYITSPRIITILSGDLTLFSHAVRKQQWKNFGKALLINEADRQNKTEVYNKLVTELEGQFLRKVLKPEYRVHLTTLYEKLKRRDKKKNVNTNIPTGSPDAPIDPIIHIILPGAENENDTDDDKKKDILVVYKHILKRFGITNAYQAETYRSYLLDLPIRTQIMFLSIFIKDWDDILWNKVIDVFISELYDKNVQIHTLQGRTEFLIPIILNLLVNERQLTDTYQLQPTTPDDILNACLVALNFTFSESTKHTPYLVFDYFVKIGYLRNLTDTLSYQSTTEQVEKTPTIEGIIKHASLLQDKVLRDSAALMLSYLISMPNSNNINGAIQLKALASRQNSTRSDSEVRIDYVYNMADAGIKPLLYFPASMYAQATKQETRVYISIYTLFGTIAEIIRRMEVGDLNNGILELSQLRQYNGPNFQRSLYESNELADFEEELRRSDNEDDIQTTGPLRKAINKWVNSFGKTAISPHLLGKIATRMFYANNSLKPNSIHNAGDAMHRLVLAFLNAVLVEEAKEILSNANVNLNNVINDDKLFISNIRKLQNDMQDLPLSEWMLTCPLLIGYIKPTLVNEIYLILNIKESFPGYLNAYESLIQAATSQSTKTNKRPDIANTQGQNIHRGNIKTNRDLYLYCLQHEIDLDFMMDSKNNQEIYKMFPRFFVTGTDRASKAWRFREYLKKQMS